MSGKRRENTFRIDYSQIPKKPSYDEVHRFVGSTLGMTREEVLRIQCSRFHGCAFIKACDLDTAQRVVDEHDGKHTMEIDKKTYTIRMWMEDGGVDVKLYDLSEDVTDEPIVDFMEDYGDIISIREIAWDTSYLFPGIPTGFRVVRMVVKKNIPSFVIIDGENTCVGYHGQQQTCRHCGELAHSGIPCVQNKKLIAQKFDADRKKPSYAKVAQTPAGSKGTESTNQQSKSSNGNRNPAPPSTVPIIRTVQNPSSAKEKDGSAEATIVQAFPRPNPKHRSPIHTPKNNKKKDHNDEGNGTDTSSASSCSRSSRSKTKKMRQENKGRNGTPMELNVDQNGEPQL